MGNPSWRPQLVRLCRYAGVSLVSTLCAMTVLGVMTGVLSFPAGWSNVVATAIGTIPSFELNRRWVWRRRGRARPRQVLPFLAFSMCGLVLSTLAVHVAAPLSGHSSRLMHTAVVEAASVGTYAVLWLVQFVLCDRVLFGAPATPPAVAGRAAREGESDPARDDERLVAA